MLDQVVDHYLHFQNIGLLIHLSGVVGFCNSMLINIILSYLAYYAVKQRHLNLVF